MKISGYIISILICIFCFSADLKAQEEALTDSVWKNGVYITGIRAGYDLARYANEFFLPSVFEQQIQVDVGLNYRTYLMMTYGLTNVDREVDRKFNYKADGNFFRIGGIYNMLGNKNNVAGIGLMMGHSRGKHSAGQITIDETDWNNPVSGLEVGKESFTGNWGEIVLNMKVEMFANFYLGWAIRGKLLLSKNYEVIEPYILPGYGQVSSNTASSFNYYISYRIPLEIKLFDKKTKTEENDF
jgi:hypothetical protein